MKEYIIKTSIITLTFLISACSTSSKLTKATAYEGVYAEKPVTVLLMPPINKSTNVEAKDYFHATLNVPIVNSGYYVIPPFLSMAILKQESAYDSELFVNAPLSKFKEVFGADVALFTTIHKWDKSAIGATVTVKIEYILKSTTTNEVLFSRTGDIIYNASVDTNIGGLAGILADLAASAINTAATKYVDLAKSCNSHTFRDLPAGKYHPNYEKDSEYMAGHKNFRVRLP
ncbi:MAG: hypothetical protein CMP56_04935 [Flavobacteriales bacterium]|jgi:hypothetical protein|nr:hypothetical protein [Flavobacteriales bacterium]